MLTRLIYASRTDGLSYPQIRGINEAAAVHNAAAGLTGLLIYGSAHFLQVLEGDRSVVNETYQRIARDARHRNISLLNVSDIARRSFVQWSMRLILLDEAYGTAGSKILNAYGLVPFDPEKLSGANALEFLLELLPTVAAQGEGAASCASSDAA